jgi:hypothetical protein
MNGWQTNIRCYVSPAGNNKIADWYKDLSTQGKADADAFLRNMRMTRRWEMPMYRPRLTNGDGLGELRWESEEKQHRLLGFFFEGHWHAVQGCTHKQQIYKPPECLETAKKYKKQIERREVRTVDYDL